MTIAKGYRSVFVSPRYPCHPERSRGIYVLVYTHADSSRALWKIASRSFPIQFCFQKGWWMRKNIEIFWRVQRLFEAKLGGKEPGEIYHGIFQMSLQYRYHPLKSQTKNKSNSSWMFEEQNLLSLPRRAMIYGLACKLRTIKNFCLHECAVAAIFETRKLADCACDRRVSFRLRKHLDIKRPCGGVLD